MLKHVQLSPFRSRSDTLSLSSTASYSSLSPEPLSSRSSSYSSLSETSPSRLSEARFSYEGTGTSGTKRDPWSRRLLAKIFIPSECTTTIKVYARCLRPDIEYKTLSITFQTTCREVVTSLLNKYRMRLRDPNLFYLTMEVTVRKAGVRTMMVLDEESRPAALQSCHPRGDSRFSLQTRRGGLVKVYDSVLMPGSKYKSLLISDRTTVDDLIQILLNYYNSKERVEQFSLYEECQSLEYQRKLHPDDCPLQVQNCWDSPLEYHFLIRRNLHDFRLRRKAPWTPELPAIPSSSRHRVQEEEQQSSSSSDLQTSRLSSSSCADYENYFYI